MNIFGSGGREDNRSLVNVDKDFTELVYKYQDELYRYACYLIYDKAEAFDIVQDTFSELPLPAREIAFLKYFEDFTFKQIAEHLDIGENTVKSHFYRAKSKIYHLLKQNLYGRTR